MVSPTAPTQFGYGSLGASASQETGSDAFAVLGSIVAYSPIKIGWERFALSNRPN